MEFNLIEAYYKARGIAFPDQKSALLFFLSEVGELSKAYLSIKPVVLSEEEEALLEAFSKLGMQADAIVSRIPGWIRNNDRTKQENISHEVADCEMMLNVFMHCFSGQSGEDALRAKMHLKLGYPIEEALKKQRA